MLILPMAAAAAALAAPAAPGKPFFRAELLFAPMKLHNHGSCVVELPGGDLQAVWYRGSGERTADDVAVYGARLRRGSSKWSEPVVMMDTPGLPDTNPCAIVDPMKRLWLFVTTIQDNEWRSGLLKFMVSSQYGMTDRAPIWEREKVLHMKPGPEFQATVRRELPVQCAAIRDSLSPKRREELDAFLPRQLQLLESKLSVRLGWMGRPHPTIIDGTRMLLPLYSDGFDFSLIAITDDWGATWHTSTPIVGIANVQPSLVRRRDGTLIAYMRDNGPPPQRIPVSESTDRGETWSRVHDSEVVDSGAGVEAIVLKSGRWLLLSNDTENGRYRLGAAISEDEGRTWPWVTYIERDATPGEGGSYHYPSIIQAADGTIHVTYSYTPNASARLQVGAGESIKHAHFNEAWLLSKREPR